MTAVKFLIPGEAQLETVRAAVADGAYRAETPQRQAAALKAHQKGYLDRDRKDGFTWYPTEKARDMLVWLDQREAERETDPIAPRMPTMRHVDSIDVGFRLRPIDQSRVEALKPSIFELGLRTPISVQGKPDDARVTLSAGAHRLEAVRQLGVSWIGCFHEDGDDLDRELWEIDENLCRAELTAADRALFIFRRKEIYLMRHPETAAGGDRRSKRQDGVLNSEEQSKTFAVATAEATGIDRRTIERDAARGAKISDRALHRLRGSRLDNGVFLDRLKHVPADQQVLYVEAALAEEKQKAAEVKESRRKLAELRHTVRLAHMAHVVESGAAEAGIVVGHYPVIYADPPWRYGVYSEVTGREKSAENHYPTLSTDEICALWEKIGAPAKRDAVLFLWATNPMLPDGLRVMEAWGFRYVHHWIWDKETAGTGYWGRDRHELLLIGKRGDPVAPLPGSQPETVYRETKGRHSAKPDFYAETIEQLYPDMLRLEMFCRSPRPGWRAWGYEAASTETIGEVA